MKTLHIELKDNIAIVTNKEPVYLDKGDKVEFKIVNTCNESDKFAYVNKARITEIKGNSFTLDYDDIRDTMFVRILWYKEESNKPEFYVLKDLNVHDVKVIGLTIDEKYPEILQHIDSEIKTLKEAFIDVFEILFELRKDGKIR